MIIEIQNALVHYKLDIHRRMNIIKGDSGIGKTVLFDLFYTYNNNIARSG